VPDYPYTTLMMARDTLGLMDQLGIERAHVFGKSLGGNIGQWMALEQPKRLRSLVMTSTFAKPNARRAAMVRWWMATAVGAGYDKLFPGLMTYFYTPEYSAQPLRPSGVPIQLVAVCAAPWISTSG
jgi:pimeloyl-ACP methyl ester carboxylesterase